MSHHVAVYQVLVATCFQRWILLWRGSKIPTFGGNRSNANVGPKHLSPDICITATRCGEWLYDQRLQVLDASCSTGLRRIMFTERKKKEKTPKDTTYASTVSFRCNGMRCCCAHGNKEIKGVGKNYLWGRLLFNYFNYNHKRTTEISVYNNMLIDIY
jgi:hypothetical protein